MTVGDRIKEARSARGMTRPQLAERSGLKYPTLAGIENNAQAGSTQLPILASALGVNVHWLLTGKGPRDAGDAAPLDAGWSDVVGFDQKAALGDGAIQDDYAETHSLKFRAASLRRKGLNAARLAVYYGDGDSMEPTIKPGDAILFDTSDTRLQDGKIFMVRYDGHITAKRMLKLGQAWFLSSDNVADPKWRKPVPIDETKDFEVIGRVRWIAGWED